MKNRIALGAELPFFLPNISLFLRMAASDLFVVADLLKFSSRSQVQRSNIYLQNKKKWLTVPVFNKKDNAIKDVKIDHHEKWAQKINRRIRFAYHDAPYFDEFYPELVGIFDKKSGNLLDLNLNIITWLKEVWDINTSIRLMSNIFKKLPESDLELKLCEKLSADYYVVDAMNKSLIKSFFPPDQITKTIFINYDECMPLELQIDYSISAIDFLFRFGPKGAIVFREVKNRMIQFTEKFLPPNQENNNAY